MPLIAVFLVGGIMNNITICDVNNANSAFRIFQMYATPFGMTNITMKNINVSSSNALFNGNSIVYSDFDTLVLEDVNASFVLSPGSDSHFSNLNFTNTFFNNNIFTLKDSSTVSGSSFYNFKGNIVINGWRRS